MFLNDNSEKVVERYSKKFSREITQAVRTRFGQIFGARVSERVVYEKWVISLQVGADVQAALRKNIHGIQIHLLRDFVLKSVLPAITRFRELPHTNMTTLPGDKWLLDLIDRFQRYGLIAGEKSGA